MTRTVCMFRYHVPVITAVDWTSQVKRIAGVTSDLITAKGPRPRLGKLLRLGWMVRFCKKKRQKKMAMQMENNQRIQMTLNMSSSGKSLSLNRAPAESGSKIMLLSAGAIIALHMARYVKYISYSFLVL